MPKHADDEPVMVTYSSLRSITFRSRTPESLGYTWGDWRDMSGAEQAVALSEFANRIVDIEVVEDESQ